MGFLSPALLALGAAVAVPLILHLFQRHQGPRVIFPALRYLRRAETEHARRIRFRQLLLMLLRVAALLLLALAAARPFLRSAGARHQPSAVAIVLDNSMSTSAVTGDRRMLDVLKDVALETLDDGEPEDVFWLIRAGSPWEPAWPGDAALTARRVRETRGSSAAGDMAAAIARAAAVLQAGAGGRAPEIEVLGDLQATGYPTAADASVGAGPPLIVWVPSADPPRNITVASVDIAGGLPPVAGQRSSVAVRVTGDAPPDSVNIRLLLDGRVIGAATAPLGSASILPFPARDAGWISGAVEKDPDALRPDDRRFFATRVAPPPAVAVSGGLGLAGEALNVLEQAGRIRRTDLRSADVALLPAGRGLESLPPAENVIIVAPDSLLELPAVNRRLAAAGLPWQLATPEASGETRFALPAQVDPALRSLDDVRLRTAFRLVPQGASPDSVLLRLSDGSAWAVRGERPGGGRYIILASPLGESATTLVSSPALVPLLDRLLGPWVANRLAVADVAPGSAVSLPPGTTGIVTPGGTTEPASADYRVGIDAGVYRFVAGDSTLGMVAVNPPAAESDLTRIDARRVRALFPANAIFTANNAQEWRTRIYRERVGRELWRTLALLALGLLVGEALVAASGAVGDRSGGRRAPARAPSPRRETTHAGD